MELQIERNGRVFDTPVVPQLAATAPYGDIGVKLAPNAEMKHKCGSRLDAGCCLSASVAPCLVFNTKGAM